MIDESGKLVGKEVPHPTQRNFCVYGMAKGNAGGEHSWGAFDGMGFRLRTPEVWENKRQHAGAGMRQHVEGVTEMEGRCRRSGSRVDMTTAVIKQTYRQQRHMLEFEARDRTVGKKGTCRVN